MFSLNVSTFGLFAYKKLAKMKIIKGILIGIGLYALCCIPMFLGVNYPTWLCVLIGVATGFLGQIINNTKNENRI